MSDRGLEVGVVCLAVVVGCGHERPPLSDDLVESSESLFAAASAQDDSVPHVCAPGTARACTFYYQDESATRHCFPSTQFCRSNATGWLPCHEPYVDAGPPPEPAETEPEEDTETPLR